jgi:L-asparaginase
VLPGIREALRARVPVVVVSRCAEGRVAPLYGFEGGGERLAKMGAILAGDLGGPKARIRLMVALGLTRDPAAIRALFDQSSS